MARQSPVNRIAALLDRFEPSVRDAFIAAVVSGRDSVNMAALEDALRRGDVARAVDLLSLPQGVLFPLDQELIAAYAAGGGMVVEGARKAGIVMGFDGRHPRAEAWARGHVGNLITGLQENRDETIQSVRGFIQRGLEEGWNPRRTALDLAGRVDRKTGRRVGGIIGLDGPRQDRYLRVSEALDSPSGIRSLVTQRRDGSLAVNYKVNKATENRILRAYRAGEGLSPADRALSMRQYHNLLLQDRAETIARTEAITALRQGRREGFLQAIEQGHVPPDGLKRVWDATMDSRTRDGHQAMDGEELEGMDEAWTLPDGSRMMTPGDSSLGASGAQTINCRCFERYDVDWIGNA